MSKNYFYIDGKKIEMSDETAKSILDSQKPERLTYKDIAKKLFGKNDHPYISGVNNQSIARSLWSECYANATIGSSVNQLESILALNKLCNVAKYLNDGWLPDWTTDERKYFIQTKPTGTVQVNSIITNKGSDIYFKSKELAQQAIEILTEHAIKKALTLNH